MERWSSRLGFVLAAVGAAVGLGNIWRFSAVVGQNGGGAYLVPYLLAAFALAVPLLILELSVGRALRLDVVAAFRSVRREFAVLGWVVAGSVLLILSYYLVLTGWVLAFLVDAVGGGGLSFAGFTGTLWPVAAFASMQYGGVVAVAFFGLLFFAALTSSVSLLEVGVAAALRTTDRSRREMTALLTGLVFLAGLPSALSYSGVGFAIGGVRFLDLMDESVGALALPVTATLIAVVFTWYQDRAAVARQVGAGIVLPLVKYGIPAVLVTVTAIRLAGGGPVRWQLLGPTVAELGGPVRLAVLIVEGVLLYLVGRVLARRLPSRLRRRSSGRE